MKTKLLLVLSLWFSLNQSHCQYVIVNDTVGAGNVYLTANNVYILNGGVFVNSGSSACLLALASLDLEKGSEIITPALTFSTTLAPIIQLGFKPTESLIKLIDKEIKSIKVKTNDMFDSDLVKKNSLLNTKKHLTNYISQWDNVQLGDKVEYK